MKKTILFLATMLVLFTGCTDYDDDIAAIGDRLDKIEGTTLATIDQQITHIKTSLDDLEGVDAALQQLIDDLEAEAADLQKQLDDNAAADAATKKALETEIADIKALISALQEKDAELEQQYLDLEQYINDEIQYTEEWASFTFATLEQYEELQMWIEAIKVSIKNLNDWCSETDYLLAMKFGDIEKAIAATEESMKQWVNETLADGYYDIAGIDALLLALETKITDGDADLQEQIDGQKAALEDAKEVLTAAYEDAIEDAVANDGVIDKAIAAAVKAAQDALLVEINGIKIELADLEDRIADLEKNFANRIQSLVFVPQYSDGKILMDYTGRTTQAHFRISPAAIAKLIAVENVEAFARYTNDPTTRAYEPEFPLVVVSVTGDETGMLEVNLKEDSENLFDTDFWAGKKEAVIYIQITDENGNNVVSDAIPMMAHGYGSNEGNRVYGFGDGNTYTGEITE